MTGEARNFDHTFWIGNGKHYPKYSPADLNAYRDSLYDVPDPWAIKLLPETDMTISTSILKVLPSRRSTLVNVSAHSCFLVEVPTENLESLLERIFEYQHGVSFTDVPKSQRHLQLKQLTLLSPTVFLINLDMDKAPVIPQGRRAALEVAQSDLSHFLMLRQNLQKLVQVQKLLSGSKKVVISDNDDEN